MKVLQAGIDKSGNYWLWRILQLLMEEAKIPRKSWILQDPIYQVSKTWTLSFPGATELDVITWDTTPANAYREKSYARQPLRDRSYYYTVIPMYRRRIQDLGEYVSANTHLWTHAPWHDDLPAELLSGIDKTVYIIRDPRDVLVSAAHYVDSEYCKREFGIPRIPLAERYGRLLVTCPEWAVHVAGWIGHASECNLHVVSYEGLVTDLPFQLKRLASYLELDLSDEQIQRVETQVAFDSMKSQTKGGHVRKGVVGNWRNELPEIIGNDATAICSPLLNLLGYEGSGGDLSSFLMQGEPSEQLMDELRRINALQESARNQVASGPAAGSRQAPQPGVSTGWR